MSEHPTSDDVEQTADAAVTTQPAPGEPPVETDAAADEDSATTTAEETGPVAGDGPSTDKGSKVHTAQL